MVEREFEFQHKLQTLIMLLLNNQKQNNFQAENENRLLDISIRNVIPLLKRYSSQDQPGRQSDRQTGIQQIWPFFSKIFLLNPHLVFPYLLFQFTDKSL